MEDFLKKTVRRGMSDEITLITSQNGSHKTVKFCVNGGPFLLYI